MEAAIAKRRGTQGAFTQNGSNKTTSNHHPHSTATGRSFAPPPTISVTEVQPYTDDEGDFITISLPPKDAMRGGLPADSRQMNGFESSHRFSNSQYGRDAAAGFGYDSASSIYYPGYGSDPHFGDVFGDDCSQAPLILPKTVSGSRFAPSAALIADAVQRDCSMNRPPHQWLMHSSNNSVRSFGATASNPNSNAHFCESVPRFIDSNTSSRHRFVDPVMASYQSPSLSPTNTPIPTHHAQPSTVPSNSSFNHQTPYQNTQQHFDPSLLHIPQHRHTSHASRSNSFTYASETVDNEGEAASGSQQIMGASLSEGIPRNGGSQHLTAANGLLSVPVSRPRTSSMRSSASSNANAPKYPPPPPSMQTHFVIVESYNASLGIPTPGINPKVDLPTKPNTGDPAAGYGPEYSSSVEDGLPASREEYDPNSDAFASFYAILMRWYQLAAVSKMGASSRAPLEDNEGNPATQHAPIPDPALYTTDFIGWVRAINSWWEAEVRPKVVPVVKKRPSKVGGASNNNNNKHGGDGRGKAAGV